MDVHARYVYVNDVHDCGCDHDVRDDRESSPHHVHVSPPLVHCHDCVHMIHAKHDDVSKHELLRDYESNYGVLRHARRCAAHS